MTGLCNFIGTPGGVRSLFAGLPDVEEGAKVSPTIYFLKENIVRMVYIF